MEEIFKYVGIILGSSVGVALINWAATSRKGIADREATAKLQAQREHHEATLQAQKEAHEANLRRQADHDEARRTFLPMAESLVLFFTKAAYEVHWEEVGIFVFPSTERPILEEQAAVVDAARSIMWGHPTNEVRDQAREIYSKLVGYWFDTDRVHGRLMNDEGLGLSQEEANGLEEAAEELIQRIHAQPLHAEGVVSQADASAE